MAGGADDYLWPGTDVLANKAGLRDAGALEEFERTVTTARLIELSERPLPGAYDLAHLRAMHGHIFQDVYEWAGQLRTVNITKGSSPFAAPEFIEPAAADVFSTLAREDHLRGLGRDQFIDRAAHYLGEINALHPFREGNGRAQRAFLSQLAAADGRHIAWNRIDANRNVEASRAAHRGELAPMRGLLHDAVRAGGSPARPQAAHQPRTFADRSRARPRRDPGRGR